VIVPIFARNAARRVFHKIVQLNVALHRREYQYVFVLAHARSGSTLLSHILASHPDFAGAGESYVTYRTPSDLSKLVQTTCEYLHKVQLDEEYIVDQINVDTFLTDETLASRRIYGSVILIREPEGTLKSLVGAFGRQEAAAVDYYVDRLATLARYGALLAQRAIWVEYDDIVERTEVTLAGLTHFFGVDPPFRPDYLTHRKTGKVGDPSSNIMKGRIFRTQKHDVEISPQALAEAALAYRTCRQKLASAGVPSIIRYDTSSPTHR
jgi:hypothetical protein